MILKPHGNGLDQWKEGGCGGSEGAETMLGVREGEGGSKVGEQQALQHLHRRAEKGDWTVGGTERGGLTRLGDGDEGSGLPDGGDGGAGEGEVESCGEIVDAGRAQVAKVKDIELIWTHGGGSPRAVNGVEDLGRGERGERVG